MKKSFIVFLALFIAGGIFYAHQSRAEDLSTKLKGRILLQVESHGEAWYVNPKDAKRYYMANGSEAYNIMRTLGVGITNANLNKIKSDKNFAKKNQGKIFLQVELHGEAYYIDSNGVLHYLKDGDAAYSIMRELGLGIKNLDLIKIILSDKDATPQVPPTTTPIIVTDTYDVSISSSTCILESRPTSYGTSLVYVRARVNGIAEGPLGTRVELPFIIWPDDNWYCGDWTLTTGALVAVGSTCTRQEGQPEETTFIVDTGGEEQGSFLAGKTRSYSAKIYKKGALFSEKVATSSMICQ